MRIINLLDKRHTFAIIGASNNPTKYGYKIYFAAKKAGLPIYPVNNKEEQIQGDKVYSDITMLPVHVDVLNFVVPPQISLQITEQAYNLGYETFWYQPGSFDETVLNFHKNKNTKVISDMCLLIESEKLIS